jgi:hypothetical protein
VISLNDTAVFSASFRTNASPRTSATVGGVQGNFSTSSAARRPSVVTVAPVSSNTTSAGMPFTLNVADSFAFKSRAEKGRANQGISPRYSSNAASSRSLDTNTTSKSFPISPVSCS